MNTRETQLKAFDRLLGIMEELREKCPWDKQTLQTLRHLTIEETYELGMPDNDLTEVKKGIGRLMLHIVFLRQDRKQMILILQMFAMKFVKVNSPHPHIWRYCCQG
jgi:uncharacterized protein YabN with tetrapyrrole methylase and pyrophosphatase domain